MSNSFNFDEALKDLQAGKDLTGRDGILMPLIVSVRASTPRSFARVLHSMAAEVPSRQDL
jgi:hypothetical protein